MNWGTSNIWGLSEIGRGWLRDMTKLSITIQIASWFIVASICSQTVHRNDLDYFVGQLRINNTDSGSFIDCCEFTDWFVERPDLYLPISQRRPKLRSVQYSRKHHLVAKLNPLTKQSGKFVWSGRGTGPKEYWGYRFYILMDYFGHESQSNVLTAWKPSQGDSLTYVCGQIGPFESGIGIAEVEKVTSFPDNSLLLVVYNHGEGYGRYDFFRGESPCRFVRFYSRDFEPYPRHYDLGNYERVIYNFERLLHPSYQLSEITEVGRLVAYPDSSSEATRIIIDSTTVDIIDLWEMAKEYFKIDSTDSR